jgi:prepilin-type N-terminal cleavage/methylation domain-containing protein/prepilin-type processing-associated H-X9-DG protein
MAWYRMTAADRRGVTLVELLVVAAILAILFGILTPVLQMFRESARRSSCGNNMRQLALAMATYADVRREFPGWRNSIDAYSKKRAASDVKEAAVSWTVPILPHIEGSEIYDWYTGYSDDPNEDNKASDSKIRTYLCPSHGDVTTTSPLSYAANAGTGGEVLAQENADDPADQFPGDGVFPDVLGNLSGDPLFDDSRPKYRPAKVTPKDIASDGAAMTILLSERAGPAIPQDISWSDNPRPVRENRGAIHENHTILHPLPIGSGWRTDIRVINPSSDSRPLPSPEPGNADLNDWNLRYPSSRHPRVVNTAFCDGHVERISEEIDAWVYCQLLSSNSQAASDGVVDWQQHFDESGNLVPYTLTRDDLFP